MEIKPDIDISVDNEYAFRNSCENGHLEIAKWLLEIKPDIDISSWYEYAFRNSCENGYLEIAKWFVSINSDKYTITIKDNDLVSYKVNIIIPKTILKSELQQEIEECLVCLTNISNIYTTCFHLYCKDCIIKWLDKNTTCPYCRSVISIDDLMMII